MSLSAGERMLDKFGMENLELTESSGSKKPVEAQIRILSVERDRLDVEIKRFREIVLHPTKYEHRYFVSLKDARKKIQTEIRRIRRFERRKDDKELHESLNIMTKAELKDWRVLSHKLDNIELNLQHLQQKLSELHGYSKFEGLHDRVKEETIALESKIQYYRASMNEVQSIVTKHYYRDKMVADQERQKQNSFSSTTECKTSKLEEVTV
jgi:hypothetical protein